MKGEIIYSKYDSNEVTEALDFVLDTRDKLFFDNIFQYSKWGCVHGGTQCFSVFRSASSSL